MITTKKCIYLQDKNLDIYLTLSEKTFVPILLILTQGYLPLVFIEGGYGWIENQFGDRLTYVLLSFDLTQSYFF